MNVYRGKKQVHIGFDTTDLDALRLVQQSFQVNMSDAARLAIRTLADIIRHDANGGKITVHPAKDPK